jgi:aryl-alcohol dehydrogenase-like predicted oxidoreductase
VRQRPGVTSVIIGPRAFGQLTGNLKGVALGLPAEAVNRLEEVSRSTTISPVNGMNDPTRPAFQP